MKLITISVKVNEVDYLSFKEKLDSNAMTFSKWLRLTMKEQLGKIEQIKVKGVTEEEDLADRW